MTDRVRTLTVVLERDTRVDDVEVIVEAIRMTKGVLQVYYDEEDVVTSDDHISRIHVYSEVREALLEMLQALGRGQKFEVVVK